MRVLILPINIASFPSITADSLNQEKGIRAVFLNQSIHKFQTVSGDVIFIPNVVSKRNPLKWIKHKLFYNSRIHKLIKQADVLHYFWSSVFPSGRDLKWAKLYNIPVFIEWVGSDIRNPVYLKRINPFYKVAYENGYEYASIESEQRSLEAQKFFARYNAVPILSPEMKLYIDKKVLPIVHTVMQRIKVKDFSPEYPDPNNKRPLIIHSPSAKIAKGSNYVLQVIETLRKKFDFDFQIVHGLTRVDGLAIMQKADIFIDQLIIGNYGMASMEAMSLGKPVMCYILPEMYEAGLPRECPVVNTNPDNLEEQLIKLINNPQLRHDIGRKSREYVEQYHDASKISKQLINIYAEAVKLKKECLSN